MKAGIMNKDVYFAIGRVAQSFRKFRPEGLNGYLKVIVKAYQSIALRIGIHQKNRGYQTIVNV